MIFMTSSLIGFVATGFRSVIIYAVVAFLILSSFLISFIFSPHHPALIGLVLSILGYNFGILATTMMIVLTRRRVTSRAS